MRALKNRPLTPKQNLVVAHLAKGMCDKDIAAAIGISPGVVKVYLTLARAKTGCENRLALALWFERRKLLDCLWNYELPYASQKQLAA